MGISVANPSKICGNDNKYYENLTVVLTEGFISLHCEEH